MGRVHESNPNLSLTPYLPRPAQAGLSFSPRQSRSFRFSAELLPSRPGCNSYSRRWPSARPANDNAAGRCQIKGNISSRGERIYHVPGGAYYGRTKISPAKGERFFCSEAEAEAAGWRASLR